MSTTNEIKNFRDRLAKEVTDGKKQYDQMAANLRSLAEKVKASEVVLAEKMKHLAGLDALLRDSVSTPAPTPVAKAKTAVKTTAKAEKATKKTAKKAEKVVEVKKADSKTPKTKTPKAKGKRATQSLAAEGRRAVAEGKRPPIKDAIAKVMGTKTMSIDDIFEGLKAKTWLPNSSEPRQYIAYLLSTSKDRFERVASAGRGFYRAKSGDTKAEPVAKTAPKAEPVAKTENHTTSTDEILANAGVLGNAVFGG